MFGKKEPAKASFLAAASKNTESRSLSTKAVQRLQKLAADHGRVQRSREEQEEDLDYALKIFRNIQKMKDKYKEIQQYTEKTSYPCEEPQLLRSFGFVGKVDLGTLFYISYYERNTHRQYLAIRMLKSRHWRYHTKYRTWFQRYSEPAVVTDEYEHGTYVYFDFETLWCQRKKGEFTFEYKYLENSDTELFYPAALGIFREESGDVDEEWP